MSVTVNQINELSLKNKDVDTMIKEQLQIIDDKLLNCDKYIGNNFIIHSLPTTMPSIVGIERQDAQRIVYSNIICSLEKRGFTVKLSLTDVAAVLYVSWKSELNANSVKAMNAIIKNNIISRTELNNLISEKKISKFS